MYRRMTRQPLWKINNINIYQTKTNSLTDIEKKNLFLEQLKEHQTNKIVYTDGSKQENCKVGFAEIFKDETIRGTHSKEASIYTGELSAIKTALENIKIN